MQIMWGNSSILINVITRTEPSSEETKSDADDDQHDTDEELTMVAEVLVDSYDWQEESTRRDDRRNVQGCPDHPRARRFNRRN